MVFGCLNDKQLPNWQIFYHYNFLRPSEQSRFEGPGGWQYLEVGGQPQNLFGCHEFGPEIRKLVPCHMNHRMSKPLFSCTPLSLKSRRYDISSCVPCTCQDFEPPTRLLDPGLQSLEYFQFRTESHVLALRLAVEELKASGWVGLLQIEHRCVDHKTNESH